MLCETEDAGKLRRAAELKNDENILLQIRGQDCVAVEVRYHRTCYANYTNFLARPDKLQNTTPLLYEKSYKKFCSEIIEKKIIEEKKIMHMATIFERFLNIVKEEENIDASSFRSFRLKERLQRNYPQLVFFIPRMRNKSEMVYVENLSSEDILDEHMTIKEQISGESMGMEDDYVLPESSHTHLNELQILFNGAMIIRNKLSDHPGLKLPWPPLASDISNENARNVVPIELLNFLVWICGISEDAQLDQHILEESEQFIKAMSIAQDIVSLASNGRKHTPKGISLAIALRQLTGSSSALKLVNNLGHCVSHTFALRHETALAQLNISPDCIIPSGFSANTSTTVAWDNDDFKEDTRTGSGTTHVTGGIILQRESEHEDRTVSERKSLPRRISSLEESASRIDPYILGRRVTIDLRDSLSSLCIDEEINKDHQKGKRLLDLSFVLCRSFDDKNIPNWTGFNTELQANSLPMSTKIGYLPIIDASPTELSTVNAILRRSTEIADKLGVSYLCLVFDEAIYAKIQQIRWKDAAYYSRFIIRMGDFHMAMSYCGAISKIFKDAGLKVRTNIL